MAVCAVFSWGKAVVILQGRDWFCHAGPGADEETAVLDSRGSFGLGVRGSSVLCFVFGSLRVQTAAWAVSLGAGWVAGTLWILLVCT